jgi:hypothetical protein
MTLSSALDAGEWSASRSGRLTASERSTDTHFIGGWMGLGVRCGHCGEEEALLDLWLGVLKVVYSYNQ